MDPISRAFFFGAAGAGPAAAPPGEQIYGTGSYNWTAPAGVTEIHVVAVGSGGSNAYIRPSGGLGWKNNIQVSPGTSYTVVVGSTSNHNGSYFLLGGSKVVWGKSNNSSSFQNIPGGSYVGDGGGQGGTGGNSNGGGQGGGGAGGYSGNGGTGGATSGGGSGGGGGGVGIYGKGSNGAGGGNGSNGSGGGGGGGAGQDSGGSSNPGGGGSGGNSGYSSNGGNYGGGTGWFGNPGAGALRIIWGTGRSFPNNAT